MAFYPCKICGNPMDPIVSDGICDDCYFGQSSFLPLKNDKKSRASSRSASSGKKKRKKIQKAAALIMAMMIALSSLCLSAFADIFESGAFITDGTYMGYEVIKYEPGTEIFNKTLISYFDARWNYTDNPTQYLSFCLLDFDETGNPYIYTLSSTGFGLSVRLAGSNIHTFSFVGYTLDCELTYDPLYFRSIYMSWQDEFNFYTFESSSPDNKKEYTRTLYCNGGEFTGYQDSDKYLLLIPHSDANQATPIFNQLLTGTKDDFVGFDPTPEAGFITAKTPEPGNITCIDWVGAGTQYPLFDFWINDNKNYDKYILRISSNESYSQVLYDKGNKDNTIDWLGYNSSFGTQQFNLAFQILNYTDLQWDLVRNITDTTFTFAETDTSNRRGYVICLSDYFTVVEFLLYRAEIIDQTTGKLVASTYFSTNRTYNKGESGYGSQVSHYDDANDDGWNTDLDDGKFGNATETEKKDQMIVDNKNDIVVTYDPAGLSLDSFSDYLTGVSAQLGGFFTSCWGIVPAEIMVIFLGGLTVMVTIAFILLFCKR